MSDSTLPQQLFRAEQVRQLDKLTIEVGGVPGIQLMKRAGRAVFDALLERWPNAERILVCAGGGNNAGDGYVIAALAAQRHMAVEVLSIASPLSLKGDAQRAYQFALQEGVLVSVAESWSTKMADVDGNTVIVDALLGTGLKGCVREDYFTAISAMNTSTAPVIAVDIPSGLCSDTGTVQGEAVQAELTVTFIGCKRGLLTGQAPAYTGQILFDDLAIANIAKLESALAEVKPDSWRISTESFKQKLKPRPVDAHKGLFGHAMMIGGDTGFGGAVAMAAEACARSGVGLTSVATRPQYVTPILVRLPEAMVAGVASGQELEPLLKRPSVVVIGPGLGQSPWSEQMLQQAFATKLPLVLDADGLNILAQGRVVPNAHRENWVLTPHPGEAARLLGCSIADIQADRFAAAHQLQQRYGGVVVLKGAGTLIADEENCYLANVGNPGMASGGMGDVLAGVIGGLIAQGMDLLHAACLGVCVHGDAADLAVLDGGERGLLASDLIPYIRELLNA
ncbi:bifunctional ADP-dependent NAD(P)H-hydrate dehydratase/NAD(P)H-hydrate epimerase [Teredinibacter haidensis]|uniref:bifunctional ADP-dependent NAD(P)H-hydrate dehydratase/NAD(P)H-hydrate epimerase n=1 Tax=Teredinibacter haidensis TaxID=2731755 RepID=UPI000948F5C3|nr:bifunctional ADP-dependent NAD(P)H-hydrate dehydratase/NAD(P)H-hydrate epimerase [Teredinibacter haidensis]